ncbi:uncharacterized protein GIQ15_04762 [Arthroderma uncinatum]|uniref:uncharacterized protein n=1 Tax=Arthroderma uncinatum TaxID=74035 RepID=UPI00144AF704|nr:uncharacterized protein GIQ15_04762 [Arthroderma uncinatum]KAF3482003.1 hypothetical protein GIQ15_04762 [Arthroderma uncinatum]
MATASLPSMGGLLTSPIVLGASLLAVVVLYIAFTGTATKQQDGQETASFNAYCRFVYANFIKPFHTPSSAGSSSGQQQALENFYQTQVLPYQRRPDHGTRDGDSDAGYKKVLLTLCEQASVYDATRRRLLRGREDMLGLLAAQLRLKMASKDHKPVWVDIGGGTGYNIEAMAAFLNVEKYFDHVYLVDLSPSLCEVARQRFARLGWKNVSVFCQDAREFRVPGQDAKADLITMSYSLSMIPDYYSVVDSLSSLLSFDGTIGVCDFYVQNIVDLATRNYTGGISNRHVNWLGRVFWRAWFDVDRVNLEAARRDYLEYRFGTVISASERNYLLGGIPYYIFIGCQKDLTLNDNDAIARLDATLTESPYLSPTHHRSEISKAVQRTIPEVRSKAYESAIVNLSSNLPLPSFFYQHHHWRICYNEFLTKHTQFNKEYIYAFTWEDPRVDHRLLNITSDDVILAITSAGDNILDYLTGPQTPRRIHAVDLNPNQNHLLELKVASFTALSHRDFWKIFGEGKHAGFRDLLISHLSPHLSSQAFQFWLDHASVFTSSRHGLYETGGSRHALKLVRYLFSLFGLTADVKKMCNSQTLEEQRAIWPRIRRVLLSKPLNWAIVGTEWFAWKAAGVPANQRNMILTDYMDREKLDGGLKGAKEKGVGGQAVWEYVVNTLDPVVKETLLGDDNYFYLLCLSGQFSKRCHPTYLTQKAHTKLSTPGAFDGLRIHTDEIQEVISRITPGTLTIAVVMDSMDWFDPSSQAAATQATAFNHALKKGGRILLRSASIEPWYIAVFEQCGFSTRRVGARFPGACIDRVNMYASTWICTKTQELSRDAKSPVPLSIGDGVSTAKLERSVSSTSSSSVCEDLEI